MNTKGINLRYSLLQGFYWSFFCPIIGFATVYLVSLGIDPMKIGLIMSLGNILSVILQPIVAGIADKSKKVSLKGITIAIFILTVIPVIITMVFNPGRNTAVVLYIISSVFAWTLSPLVNSFAVYYINRGIKVNFGMARALGSLLFAGASAVLGILIKSRGMHMRNIITLILGALLISTILSFKMNDKDDPHLTHELIEENRNIGDFLYRYRGFLIVLVGIFFLNATHNMTNTYFLQIFQNIGGDEESVGIAMGIAALMEVPLMFYSDYFIGRFGSKKFLSFSMFFWVLKSILVMTAWSVPVMYGVMLIQAFSYAPFIPGTVHYTNETMGQKEKYLGQALMTGSITLGGVLGNIAGGAVITDSGIVTFLRLCVIFAVTGAVIAHVGLFMKNRKRQAAV